MAPPTKLTPDIVRQAQELRASGCGVREIAARLGVGKSQLATALAALEVVAASAPPPPAPSPVRKAAPRVPPPPVVLAPVTPALVRVPRPPKAASTPPAVQAPAPAPKARPKAKPTSAPPPPPPVPPSSPATPQDPGAGPPPLTVARELLTGLTDALADLDETLPAYARLVAEARQVARLVAALEREAAGEETAEEVARRRRREDGETRKAIERYVDQALGISLRPGPEAPHGRCPTCAVALTPEGRAALTGGGA